MMHTPTRRRTHRRLLAPLLLASAGLPVVATAVSPAPAAAAAVPAPATELRQALADTAVPFIANTGHLARDDVAYYARTFGGTLYVRTGGQLVYALPAAGGGGWAFQESLSAAPAAPQGMAPADTRVSEFRGRDRALWRQRAPTFAALDLGELYPGVRGELRARGGQIEKLFHVAPGADPGAIQVTVDGVPALAVDTRGQLVLHTARGPIHFTRPVAYQDTPDGRRPVAVAYRVEGRRYGFELGPYDPRQPLVIDPLLASTFLGGSNDAYVLGPTQDVVNAMHVVGDRVYVGGRTTSTDFPTRLGAFDGYQGGIEDGFIARFSADLSTLEAATFVGGASQDTVNAIAAGPDGTVYAAGYTNGSDFPATPGAYRGGNGVSGPFIVRLSADLGTLEAAALLGVGSDTQIGAIDVGAGALALAGSTSSPNLPTTPGAYDRSCGTDGQCNPSGAFGIRTSDAFVAKLDLALTTLSAATYLGASNSDTAAGVAIDSDGSVLVVGQSISVGFPVTPGSLIDSDQGLNLPIGFISRFSADLSTLQASSLLGGRNGLSDASAVRIAGGRVLVGGTTYTSDFPMPAAGFDRSCGSDGQCDPTGPVRLHHSDGYVIALSPALDTLLAGTYVGGTRDDTLVAIDVDAEGRISVAGLTPSDDLPTRGTASWDATRNGGTDAYVLRFDAGLQTLLAGTYLGGTGDDAARAVATDAQGRVLVAGVTASANFPVTATAFDPHYNGGAGDAFVTLLDAGLGAGANQPPVADAGPDQSVRPRARVTLDGRASTDSDGVLVTYDWRQTAGPSVRLRQANTAQARFTAPRVAAGITLSLAFELTVTDDAGAISSDVVEVEVSR